MITDQGRIGLAPAERPPETITADDRKTTITGRRAPSRPTVRYVKRAAAVAALCLPLLAACGSSSSSTSARPAATAVPTAAAVVQPDPSEYQVARDLAAKLGCPDVAVTQSGGAAGTDSVEAKCDVTAVGDEFNSQWNYEISVFPDAGKVAAYVQTVRAAYNPHGVQGDRWVVLIPSGEEKALPVAQAKVGGAEL